MTRTVKAVLFDFDGVLADTEPLHFVGFQTILAQEGIRLTWEAYIAEYVGLSDTACFEAVLRDQGVVVSQIGLAALVRQKTRSIQSAILARNPMLADAVRFVKRVTGLYRLAIVSGALREEIDLCLRISGLLGNFEHVTSAEDIGRGKPAPDPYLHALQALNRSDPLDASECLAVEDTVHGIRAARAAGLRCLAVTTTCPAGRLREADWITRSLDDVDLEGLVAGPWSGHPVRHHHEKVLADAGRRSTPSPLTVEDKSVA